MTSFAFNRFGLGHPRRFGCAVVALACVVGGSVVPVQAQNNTQRGATFGGITGAIAGAIIGENSDKAGAGAAIGGAVGIVAGGLLGNASDKDVAYRNQQYAQQRQYQTQQQMATTYAVQPAPTGTVSYSDVVAMSRSGVSQNVILNQIATRGVQRQPAVSDIISLHEQGVSDNVIAAMQQAPLGSQMMTGNVVQSTTFVETPVYVTPQPYPIHVHHGHYGPVYRARPHYHGY